MKRYFCISMIVFLVGVYSSLAAKTIYIVPFGPTYAGKALFNPEERDGTLLVFCALKEVAVNIGYDVKAVYDITHLTDVAAIVFLNTHHEPRFTEALARYTCPKLLYLWEPPSHDSLGYVRDYHRFFTQVFSLSSDQVDNKRVFKWYYPQPSLTMIENILDYQDKKLCTMIVGCHSSCHPQELYTERLRAIEFFSHYGPSVFEFYGGGWQQSRCYRGSVARKVDVLKKYRFSICYENTKDLPGYLTEKIFDCFVAGCVPVYLGDPRITDIIPADCFIDRRHFRSLDELYAYLQHMPREEYEHYLDNIRSFLASSAAYRFSVDAFIDTLLTAIEPGYQKDFIFSPQHQERLQKIR
jgi:alpha(1,3/1,4) fucosyltransferase